ncbi:MAG: fasciclin domain-containing protein [Chloroflexi bacterium]|uniref:fasciclin domain-containing protein n=1 Tax=Candidatus Flexifilum breve TaxID=3140694 RepID=UPI00313639AE|nr:fasciclin domain-containing protein [Chloroflexota bacterium]
MPQRSFLLFVLVLFLAVSPTAVSSQQNQAWVRVFHVARDWRPIDVYAADTLLFHAIAPDMSSTWALQPAGVITLAVAESGLGVVNAVLEVADAPLEAGHRYTLFIVGAASDHTLALNWFDETAAIADFDMAHGAAIINVNNVIGTPPLTIIEDGVVEAENLAVGSVAAGYYPAEILDGDYSVLETANPRNVIVSGYPKTDGAYPFYEPTLVYLFGLSGSYPGEARRDFGWVYPQDYYSVAENPTEFLNAFTGLDLSYNPTAVVRYEFTTFLSLINEAGLADVFTGDAPITVFAPTDYAFSLLPEGTLDALRADPDALRALVLNHVVTQAIADLNPRTITTLQGTEYRVTYDTGTSAYSINGQGSVLDWLFPLSDGSIVWFINDLVLLPEN